MDGTLVLSITDDGVGGAARRDGSGLTGLSDRIGAHGGTLRIEKVASAGTVGAGEHGVEDGGELAVPVADREPKLTSAYAAGFSSRGGWFRLRLDPPQVGTEHLVPDSGRRHAARQ